MKLWWKYNEKRCNCKGYDDIVCECSIITSKRFFSIQMKWFFKLKQISNKKSFLIWTFLKWNKLKLRIKKFTEINFHLFIPIESLKFFLEWKTIVHCFFDQFHINHHLSHNNYHHDFHWFLYNMIFLWNLL